MGRLEVQDRFPNEFDSRCDERARELFIAAMQQPLEAFCDGLLNPKLLMECAVSEKVIAHQNASNEIADEMEQERRERESEMYEEGA